MFSTVTIWIPNTWILDSSEYQTVWVSGIDMVQSRDLADHSNTGFWTLNRLFQSGFQTTICIPDHLHTRPFDNPTQIYHLYTRLVRYSDGYCIQIISVRFSSNGWMIQQLTFQVPKRRCYWSPCEWSESGGSKFNLKKKSTHAPVYVTSFSSISYYSNVRLISNIELEQNFQSILSVCFEIWPQLSQDWRNKMGWKFFGCLCQKVLYQKNLSIFV